MTPEIKKQVADMLYSAFAARHALKEDEVRKYLRCLVTLFGCHDILKNENETLAK